MCTGALSTRVPANFCDDGRHTDEEHCKRIVKAVKLSMHTRLIRSSQDYLDFPAAPG